MIRISRYAFHLMVVACLSPLLFGCIKNTASQGYTMDEDILKQVHSGMDKAGVIRTLGSPSATSSFGGESWFYIQNKSENVAFFTPRIKQQRVFAVLFNDGGVVKEAKEFTEADMRKIAFNSDKTKTEGHEMGIAEQLLGNIGRFNPDGSTLSRSIDRNTSNRR